MVGLLRKAMYGLREAPAIWQSVVQDIMCKLGFEACVTVPCVYYHEDRDLVVVAHVDDFLVSGPHGELERLKAEIQAFYDCEGDILGDDPGDKKELSFLGRSLRHTAAGIEWEGDSKLIKAFLERAGVNEAAEIGAVDSPGVKRDDSEDLPPMAPADATLHRGLVALLNYIAQDRVDLGFCATELSRSMAKPKVSDTIGVKRVARYLRRFPRAWLLYRWQPRPAGLEVFTDADWGGCVKTRRSTSGGLVLYGSHLLSFWSRTQQNVALSSCESEVNALVKGGTDGLGVRHLLEQCGEEPGLVLRTDASAAVGLCARQGAGKVKHLTVRQLWAQSKAADGEFTIAKVPRLSNGADMLTHHWTAPEYNRFMPMISLERPETGTGIRPRRRHEISGA